MQTWMKWVLGLGVLAALGAGGMYYYNTVYLPLRVTSVQAIEALRRLAYAVGEGPTRDRAERLLAAVAASSEPYLTRTQAQEYNALMATTGGVAGYFR